MQKYFLILKPDLTTTHLLGPFVGVGTPVGDHMRLHPQCPVTPTAPRLLPRPLPHLDLRGGNVILKSDQWQCQWQGVK